MGTCGSIQRITINLDEENLLYFTDEIISGTVCWNLEKPIQVQEISITFVGEIGYTTTSDAQQDTNVMRYHHEPFYSIKLPLEEKQVHLLPQTYSWPFQFPLMNHLPPTLNKPQSYPHVKYYLQVHVLKSNHKQIKYLTVYPRNDLLQNPQCLSSKTYVNSNQDCLTVRCTMSKLGYIPGDSMEFMLEIDNWNEVFIEYIDLFIFQFYQIQLNKHKNLVFHTTLPHIQNFKSQQIQDAFCVPIPVVSLPPSCQFHGGIQTTMAIQHSYLLRFEVKTNPLSSQIHLELPILIGSEPKLDLNVPQISSSLIRPSAPTLEQILSNDNNDE